MGKEDSSVGALQINPGGEIKSAPCHVDAPEWRLE